MTLVIQERFPELLRLDGNQLSSLGGLFANAEANYTGRVGGNYPAGNIESAIVDIDPMDMFESLQEAMHLSNTEMSGAGYIRKEAPLHVLPTLCLLNLDSPLTSFSDLQMMLYDEEQTAYNQAILQNVRDGKVHPLSFIHHTSTYQASICKLLEYWRFGKSGVRRFLGSCYFDVQHMLEMLRNEAKILEKESSPQNASSLGHRGTGKDLYSPFESNSVRSISGSGSRSRRGS